MGSAGPWSLKEIRKSQNVKARRGLGSDLIQAFFLQKRKWRPTEGDDLRLQRQTVRPGRLTLPGVPAFLSLFLSPLSRPSPPFSLAVAFTLSPSLPPFLSSFISSFPSFFLPSLPTFLSTCLGTYFVLLSEQDQRYAVDYPYTLWGLGTI